MKYISEERLRQMADNLKFLDRGTYEFLITIISRECKKLNPWIPIDDNTPKDKYLLMFIPGHGEEVMRVREIKMWSPKPTHYQEFPDDTK